jgi:hypothetical protein
MIVNVAEVSEVFPHASVAGKVTKAEPVAPQRSLRLVKLFDQVTEPEQMSEATAPPLEASHVLSAVVFPEPSHSTERSADPDHQYGDSQLSYREFFIRQRSFCDWNGWIKKDNQRSRIYPF